VVPNTDLIKTLMVNGLDKVTLATVEAHRYKKSKNSVPPVL
jgi:hypothetical protein